jgi:hypothetical protein
MPANCGRPAYPRLLHGQKATGHGSHLQSTSAYPPCACWNRSSRKWHGTRRRKRRAQRNARPSRKAAPALIRRPRKKKERSRTADRHSSTSRKTRHPSINHLRRREPTNRRPSCTIWPTGSVAGNARRSGGVLRRSFCNWDINPAMPERTSSMLKINGAEAVGLRGSSTGSRRAPWSASGRTHFAAWHTVAAISHSGRSMTVR